jgi:hypothetical protein
VDVVVVVAVAVAVVVVAAAAVVVLVSPTDHNHDHGPATGMARLGNIGLVVDRIPPALAVIVGSIGVVGNTVVEAGQSRQAYRISRIY